jgi:RES domain-containing protein
MTAWFTAWRIAVAPDERAAESMSGVEAEFSGGRWNSPGTPAVYCSDSAALAFLETLVRTGGSTLPLQRYLVASNIPGDVFRDRVDARKGRGGPATNEDAISDVHLGDRWLASNSSAVLTAPSEVVPEELILLINPLHPDAKKITATISRRLSCNPLGLF